MKLSKMKAVEMRKELEARGLDSTGTRPTLMKRLREALENEESKNLEQQPSNEVGEAGKTTNDTSGSVKDNNDGLQDPKLDEAGSGKELLDTTEDKNLQGAGNEVQGSSQTPPSTEGSGQPEQAGNSVVASSTGQSSEISMDERLKKRQERFGTISNAPPTADEAIQRRRKRFGIVQNDTEERPAKRRNSDKQVNSRALKEHEEAKKRRALKFGTQPSTRKEPGAEDSVPADEMEKRLKRQRRFQQVGS